MLLTTLCYLIKDGQWLMLHRISKKDDVNAGKWIGVGGKFEPGEAPEECLTREVFEETGLTLVSYAYRGLITFVYNNKEPELIFTYTADAWEGELHGTDEGRLAWIPEAEVPGLPVWEGDRYLLRYLLEGRREPFSLKLCYHDDELTEAWELSGAPRRLG